MTIRSTTSSCPTPKAIPRTSRGSEPCQVGGTDEGHDATALASNEDGAAHTRDQTSQRSCPRNSTYVSRAARRTAVVTPDHSSLPILSVAATTKKAGHRRSPSTPGPVPGRPPPCPRMNRRSLLSENPSGFVEERGQETP